MTFPQFVSKLRSLLQGLLYPSESDFAVEIAPKGLLYRMPSLQGVEVRSLEQVFTEFLRQQEPRWQGIYEQIQQNCIATTAWHYPVKRKNYNYEMVLICLHREGVLGLWIRLVET